MLSRRFPSSFRILSPGGIVALTGAPSSRSSVAVRMGRSARSASPRVSSQAVLERRSPLPQSRFPGKKKGRELGVDVVAVMR